MPDGAFEYFVRPFQSPAPHGSGRIPSTPRDTREKATLTWGAKANMPAIVPKSVNVNCCTSSESQDPLPAEPEIFPEMRGPYAKAVPSDADWWKTVGYGDTNPYPTQNVAKYALLVVQNPEINQQQFGYLHRQSQNLMLDKAHKDTCAGDWAQFSGVGLAIDEALAEFDAAIKAGGSGVKTDHCRTSWQLNNYFDNSPYGPDAFDPVWGEPRDNPYPGDNTGAGA